MVPDRLKTERLLLRPAVVGDAPAVFDYASDPVVSRYLPWPPHADVGETEEFLRRCEADWRTGRSYPWAIVFGDEGGVVGMIQATITGHRASLGYVLNRKVWGRGLASEAARAVVEALFDVPEVSRVWATCDMDNPASGRVLEKAGLHFEGILHRWDRHNVSPEPRDVRVYAVWRAHSEDATRVVGLHHVQLAMPPGGEPEAVAFYQGLLGIPQVEKPPHLAVRGGCWFEDGATRIHLGVEEGFSPARKAHPALLVSDLAGVEARLEAAGVEIVVDQALPGFDRVYVSDPFGNRIELLQPLT